MARERKPSYTVSTTAEFNVRFQELSKRYVRMPQLLDAILWTLERIPHKFTQFMNDLYVLPTGKLDNPEFPEVRVLYRVIESESRVIIMDIDDLQ